MKRLFVVSMLTILAGGASGCVHNCFPRQQAARPCAPVQPQCCAPVDPCAPGGMTTMPGMTVQPGVAPVQVMPGPEVYSQ
jgi:hypothetical protein